MCADALAVLRQRLRLRVVVTSRQRTFQFVGRVVEAELARLCELFIETGARIRRHRHDSMTVA
jgi:quercetin dioxygenase-like cupin family protein